MARIFGEKPEHKKSLKLQMLLKRFASPLCADYIWPPETFTLKKQVLILLSGSYTFKEHDRSPHPSERVKQ